MKEILIKGNSKMGKEVYLFNIPPKQTCTPTDWCLYGRNGKPACYGLRNNFLMSNAIDSAKERYAFSQTKEFVPLMIEAIHSKKAKYFRLHSTGDFYNEEYVKKIIQIAKECPETKFRTTTRRRDLTKIIQELNSLPNFIVRESLDKDRLNPEMGLPYTAIASILPEKLKIESKNNLSSSLYECVNDCTECQHYCWNSRTNVYFEEH